MKPLHYIVLNQSTPLFIQRFELICITKKRKRRGEKCLSKWIFFQYLLAVLFVHIGVGSPFSIPTQAEVLKYPQKEQVFIAILWCIFQDHHYSFLTSTSWEQVTASQSSKCARISFTFKCKLPLLQSAANSTRLGQTVVWRRGGRLVKNWSLLPLPRSSFRVLPLQVCDILIYVEYQSGSENCSGAVREPRKCLSNGLYWVALGTTYSMLPLLIRGCHLLI